MTAIGDARRAFSGKWSIPVGLRRSLPALSVVVVVWICCFNGLGAVGLFDLDEGLYATVARQMVESGDWIVPHIASLPFFDKPPLTYWLQALSLRLLGPTPQAARLPSAVAALLTALLLWAWARRQGNERVGWLAGLMYPLCPLTMVLARQATMDSLLTLWLTAAVVGWIAGEQGDRRGYLLMAFGAGLATLTKGLMGGLLPGAAFVLWLLLHRDGRPLRRVPWVPALGVYLAVALPWHLAVWRASGPVFLHEYIVHHHIQRFLGQDFGHKAPLWYYAPVLLVGLFPWSAFVLRPWWESLRDARREDGAGSSAGAIWAIWALVIVGGFSLSKSKLPGYVQPAVPALLLLAAVRLDRAWSTRRGLSRGEGALLGAGGLLLSGLLFGVGALGWRWHSQPVARLGHRVVPASVSAPVAILAPLLLALGVLFLLGTLLILAGWSDTRRVIAAAAAVNLAFGLLAGSFLLPAWGTYEIRPLHDLARQALPAIERGEPLVIYHFVHRRPSLRFVLGHTAEVFEIPEPAALQQMVRDRADGYILAAREEPMPSLARSARPVAMAGRWSLWRWGASSPRPRVEGRGIHETEAGLRRGEQQRDMAGQSP